MPQKQGPGCKCCQCQTAFDDRFTRADSATVGTGWTEVDNVWSISSNKLVASAPGKVIASHTDADGRFAIVCDFELPTVGDKMRVLVAYLDANNYAYAEVEHVSTGSPFNRARIRTYKVHGGTHTLLDAGPQAGNASYVAADNPIPTFRVKVCWRENEKRIAAEFYNGVVSGVALDEDIISIFSDLYFLGSCEAIPIAGSYGTDFGFEAAVVGGSEVRCKFVKVYDLRTQYNDNTKCPFCVTGCNNCADGYAADTFSVAVSGDSFVPSGTYLYPTSFSAGTCGGTTTSGFNWTLILAIETQGLGVPEYRVKFSAVRASPSNTFIWATAWSTTKPDCRTFSSTPLSPVAGTVTPDGTCLITSV